jgi:hypothetical protein
MSADSLTTIYDRMVPPGMRIADASQVTLTVIPTRDPTGMDAARTIEHFSRAIASIGMEIAEPGAARQLTAGDYLRAPVRMSATPGGPLVLTADVTGAVLGQLEAGGRTVTQAAMARLANILPSGPDDTAVAGRVAASRAPTMRAVREVALAAKRLGGVRVSLHAADEQVEGAVDMDQARDLADLVDDDRDEVRDPYDIGAIWDGMRFSRREFFLRFESERSDLSGLVDEALVPIVRGLPDGPVIATIQDVVHARGRRTHHLVNIRPDATLA